MLDMEQFDTSSEPMDIDISSNSCSLPNDESPVKSKENSEDSDLKNLKENVDIDVPSKNQKSKSKKKYNIQKKVYRKNYTYFKLLMALFMVFIAILTYVILDVKCITELDLPAIEVKLKKRIHDQSNAIENIINGLSANTKNKILFLYGGTGVGKTLTVTILLDSVWNASNIFHFTMPSFTYTFSLDTMFGFSICKNSIIVIDDLKPHHLASVKNSIHEIIEKSNNLNKNVIIILICNCDTYTKDFFEKCNNQFKVTLEKSFKDVNAYKKFVKYESLTQDTLRKCIKDEIGHINDFDIFMNSFNVSVDGCKGVHKKIKVLDVHKENQ